MFTKSLRIILIVISIFILVFFIRDNIKISVREKVFAALSEAAPVSMKNKIKTFAQDPISERKELLDKLQKNIEAIKRAIALINASIKQPQKTSTAFIENVNLVKSKEIIFKRRLSLGMSGDDIRELQIILAKDKDIYPEGTISGYFGPLTKKAVQKFQKKYQIAKEGVSGYGEVGPMTRTELNKKIEKNLSINKQGYSVANERAEKIQQIQTQIKKLQNDLMLVISTPNNVAPKLENKNFSFQQASMPSSINPTPINEIIKVQNKIIINTFPTTTESNAKNQTVEIKENKIASTTTIISSASSGVPSSAPNNPEKTIVQKIIELFTDNKNPKASSTSVITQQQSTTTTNNLADKNKEQVEIVKETASTSVYVAPPSLNKEDEIIKEIVKKLEETQAIIGQIEEANKNQSILSEIVSNILNNGNNNTATSSTSTINIGNTSSTENCVCLNK